MEAAFSELSLELDQCVDRLNREEDKAVGLESQVLSLQQNLVSRKDVESQIKEALEREENAKGSKGELQEEME